VIVYSVLTPLEDVLRNVLEWLHGTIGLPWAWSIVALTIIVRMLLVPLTVRQIHSMQNLQAHAPQMKEIQRKYKGDKQKQNEELMTFYRENKINPAASCLPMLAQFPVFIALYFVLRNFAKSHPGGDLSWLHVVPDITANITAHWSGYLLLTIYVLSQVASTYFMSTTMDKSQRTMMMILPVVFVIFIINPPGHTVFPVGLLLYWVTTNLWTVGQGLVTRSLVPKKDVAAPKRSSRTPPRGGDDGATEPAPSPKSAPAAKSAPRKVKKKKKKARR
jgi:YidC/Oxa1 family membrane protein insertase